MNYGELKTYFKGACAKVLSVVDIDPKKSNQHEITSVAPLKALFGTEERIGFSARFLYLNDEDEPIEDIGKLSWYDSRKNNPNRSAEWRLYYSPNKAVSHGVQGDELIVALDAKNEPIFLICEQGSTIQSQLNWLFGFDDLTNRFITNKPQQLISSASEAFILELLGVYIQPTRESENYLEDMIRAFKGKFPATKDFSNYVRSTLADIDFRIDNADEILVACYNHEDMLFRVYEEQDIINRLEPIVSPSIQAQEVIEVSKSVLNRRKARAGKAFENHLSYLFTQRGVRFSDQCRTEQNHQPDFIFPSIEAYHDKDFPTASLTMLGAKTTVKERWRQILKEADRIEHKHLITMEPSISESSTNEMQKSNVQLIVPESIHGSYKNSQQKWLWSVEQFCNYVKQKQAS